MRSKFFCFIFLLLENGIKDFSFENCHFWFVNWSRRSSRNHEIAISEKSWSWCSRFCFTVQSSEKMCKVQKNCRLPMLEAFASTQQKGAESYSLLKVLADWVVRGRRVFGRRTFYLLWGNESWRKWSRRIFHFSLAWRESSRWRIGWRIRRWRRRRKRGRGIRSQQGFCGVRVGWIYWRITIVWFSGAEFAQSERAVVLKDKTAIFIAKNK